VVGKNNVEVILNRNTPANIYNKITLSLVIACSFKRHRSWNVWL